LGKAIAGLAGLPATLPTMTTGLSLNLPSGFAQISPTLVAAGLLIIVVFVIAMLWGLRLKHGLRMSDSWGCGRIGQTPRMEYTATSFAEPLRRVFVELYRPTKELTIDFNPESKYFVQSIEYKSEITPWFEAYLYNPVLRVIRAASRHMRQLQSGSLHGYIAYLFVVLLFMLVMLLWPGK
jgi:hypothetical protein